MTHVTLPSLRQCLDLRDWRATGPTGRQTSRKAAGSLL